MTDTPNPDEGLVEKARAELDTFERCSKATCEALIAALSNREEVIRREVREECAKVADDFAAGRPVSYGEIGGHIFIAENMRLAADTIAAAIRALSKPEGVG